MKRNAAARKFAKQVGDKAGDIELQNMAFDGFVAGYDFCETKQPSRLEIAARITSGLCVTLNKYAILESDVNNIVESALLITDRLIHQEAETSQNKTK